MATGIIQTRFLFMFPTRLRLPNYAVANLTADMYHLLHNATPPGMPDLGLSSTGVHHGFGREANVIKVSYYIFDGSSTLIRSSIVTEFSFVCKEFELSNLCFHETQNTQS